MIEMHFWNDIFHPSFTLFNVFFFGHHYVACMRTHTNTYFYLFEDFVDFPAPYPSHHKKAPYQPKPKPKPKTWLISSLGQG